MKENEMNKRYQDIMQNIVVNDEKLNENEKINEDLNFNQIKEKSKILKNLQDINSNILKTEEKVVNFNLKFHQLGIT